MTGREKVEATIRNCEDEAETGFTIATRLVIQANEQLEMAQALKELLAVASDQMCEKATHGLEESRSS